MKSMLFAPCMQTHEHSHAVPPGNIYRSTFDEFHWITASGGGCFAIWHSSEMGDHPNNFRVSFTITTPISPIHVDFSDVSWNCALLLQKIVLLGWHGWHVHICHEMC